MMVRPRVVPDAVVDGLIRVSGALGAKLPYGPIVAVLVVEEADEPVERIPIRALGVRLRWARAVVRWAAVSQD